jgi:Tfp pilus assembly protein FimT
MNGKKQSTRVRAGFSMIELCIVMTITMVVMGMAIPMVRQTVSRYRLGAAVSSVTGAIRATRYQALMKGYRYRLAITPSSKTYQLSSMIPPATAYSSEGSAVPITSNAVTISAPTTLEFRPNGQVSAVTGALDLDLSYEGVTKTITVSTYGNVTVTP